MAVIRFDPTELNGMKIQELVEKHSGVLIRPDLRNVEIYELDRSEDIEARLVEFGKSRYRKD